MDPLWTRTEDTRERWGSGRKVDDILGVDL